MSEDAMWGTMRDKLNKLGAHYQRFEDKLAEGIPDVNVKLPGVEVERWVELKHISGWPKRENTLVTPGDLRPAQVVWLTVGQRVGRDVRIVLRVGLERWLVFTGEFQRLANGVTKAEMLEMAAVDMKVLDVLEALR